MSFTVKEPVLKAVDSRGRSITEPVELSVDGMGQYCRLRYFMDNTTSSSSALDAAAQGETPDQRHFDHALYNQLLRPVADNSASVVGIFVSQGGDEIYVSSFSSSGYSINSFFGVSGVKRFKAPGAGLSITCDVSVKILRPFEYLSSVSSRGYLGTIGGGFPDDLIKNAVMPLFSEVNVSASQCQVVTSCTKPSFRLSGSGLACSDDSMSGAAYGEKNVTVKIVNKKSGQILNYSLLPLRIYRKVRYYAYYINGAVNWNSGMSSSTRAEILELREQAKQEGCKFLSDADDWDDWCGTVRILIDEEDMQIPCVRSYYSTSFDGGNSYGILEYAGETGILYGTAEGWETYDEDPSYYASIQPCVDNKSQTLGRDFLVGYYGAEVLTTSTPWCWYDSDRYKVKVDYDKIEDRYLEEAGMIQFQGKWCLQDGGTDPSGQGYIVLPKSVSYTVTWPTYKYN